MFFPLAMLSQYVFGPALFLLSLFIVLLILLQRGRGGGLTGALGGAGGASAFGVKAGDIFTRITAVSVLLWIVLCALTTFWYLPNSLDIASDPASLSLKKSSAGGMSGMGSSNPIPSEVAPSETAPSETAPSETAPSETAPSETKIENSTLGTETTLPTTNPVAPVSETPVDGPKPPAAVPVADVPDSAEPKP